ncbi:hypothetical protein [Paenibacillus monticola]|uniref:Uncharacterized protein n=1 Tax=Paenibacillus monticola TaxID=2666075 RepID=A0A7X2H7L0_9BACL|nr:hypothetical protein [Paenibacillus monticola]MRN55001.1 hypothetical protein [Paenibacillus monticola]
MNVQRNRFFEMVAGTSILPKGDFFCDFNEDFEHDLSAETSGEYGLIVEKR